MSYRFLIFSLLFTVHYTLFTSYSTAQQWNVPAEKKALIAPFKFDKNTIKQGENIYSKFCLSCHGNPGQGNNIKMTPQPPDPASKAYQKNTDGEIFYKMSEGREYMPSFKNIIEEKDRWLIVSYARSFNKDYVQPEPNANEAAKLNSNIIIHLTCDEKSKCININISQKVNDLTSLKGFEITLLAKRYFGNLKISDTKLSDDKGFVSLNYPADLPGDKEGNISLKVKVKNDDAGITAYKDTILKIGVPVIQTNLLDKRAMWNVRSKAPLWLMISYSVTVLAVLGIIIYIFFLLYKVWENGKLMDV